MASGRKPLPSSVRLLTGMSGHHPLNINEPKPEAVEITLPPPDHLSDEARMEWLRMVPVLIRHDMMRETDIAAFSVYCQAYGRWVRSERQLALHGDVITAKNGTQTISRYLVVSNRASDQMRQFLTEFGMTPSSRTRVAAPAPVKKSNRFRDIVDVSKSKNSA